MEKSALMAVDEVNASDAFDFTFVPHLRDPGGVVAAYHTACDDLIRAEQVQHIVGCYTSASRKQVIPIVERTERLLWHPARYEGFESSDNVIYVGAAPNHTVVPLIQHMLKHISADVFCAGSNYVWTWETNRVLREIVSNAGGRIIAERLLELGETSVDHIVREIIERKPPVVFNTLVGESSYVFMRALHAATARAGLSIPMLSCSLCEPELKLIGSAAAAGCITSSAYFESIDDDENRAFVTRWKARHGSESSVSVDGQSTYTCVMLLARAIRRAGSADVACRSPGGRQSPLRFPARSGLGGSRQQSLLPDAAPGALSARLPVRDILGSRYSRTSRSIPLQSRSGVDRSQVRNCRCSHEANEPFACHQMSKPSPFSVRGRRALMVMKDEREISTVRRQLDRLGMSVIETDPDQALSPQDAR